MGKYRDNDISGRLHCEYQSIALMYAFWLALCV